MPVDVLFNFSPALRIGSRDLACIGSFEVYPKRTGENGNVRADPMPWSMLY